MSLKSIINIRCIQCSLIAIGLLALPSAAAALSLDFAVSISQPSLKIKSTANDSVLAEMVDKATIWPSITLKTRERYFGDSNFGYTAEAMAWYMRLNRQKVGRNEVDLGTSARGYFAYLTPSIYYRFGDRYSMESPGWMTTVGVGLGVGYLNVKGTMMTTGTTPGTLQNINYSGFGASTGLFIEVMKSNWFLRLSSFGPALNNGSLKLELSDTSIKIGRRFSLDLF
ncbi:MAG TPA: hypothetical protein VKA31_09255 [Mariprofundaceae bacterium]|nr:hypothetical protein [Mariprofundaceae bacterium]